MKKYISVKEIANQWGVSNVWVTALCASGRVEGSFKNKGKWLIPYDSKKPKPKKRKKVKVHNVNAKFTFIDLFAGIGGFHQAMRYLGGECIMAAEINKACVETYNMNFKTYEGDIFGDVNKIKPKEIPKFEVLCAGFPCQPFSKAGQQKGFDDEKQGGLFYKIMDILDVHTEVEFVVLENVRNLADKTENWDVIKTELLKRDFIITKDALILSPSNFGLPQIRERVYILGIKKQCCEDKIVEQGFIDKSDLCLEKHFKKCRIGDALRILDEDVSNDYLVSEEQALMINAWDEFRIKTGIKVIGFPIWISCFGVGIDNDEDLRESVKYYDMPDWKKGFVDKNRNFYLLNRDFIDDWIERYDMLNRIKLYQKFEWNCGSDITDMHEAIIQIRQSGIRCKRNTYFPSLVAIVNTPIIWDKQKKAYRHISPREAANLQNFNKRYKFSGTDKQIYRQLGNSVNVRVLKILCSNLFKLQRRKDFKDGEKD